MNPWQIREMTIDDLSSVLAIEERACADTPWAIGIFKDCLEAGYLSYVVHSQISLLGFALMSQGVEEAHILNIAVDPDYHRKGVGSALLKHLIAKAESFGKIVWLEVRESNVPARKLYESFGFIEKYLRKDYYRMGQTRENAVVYVLELT